MIATGPIHYAGVVTAPATVAASTGRAPLSGSHADLPLSSSSAAQPLTDAELPPRISRGAPLGKEGALVSDLLKLLLKIRAREIDVAPRLLARTDELDLLASGKRNGLAILENWRFEQFGRDALDLVEGRMAFGVVDGKLRITRMDDAPPEAAPEAEPEPEASEAPQSEA